MLPRQEWLSDLDMKSRITSALASALFLVIAPGTVAGYVPWRLSGWRVEPPLLGWPWLRAFGVLLLAAGLPVLLDSFARFALAGRGTPAPIMPTDQLVVSGLYRYVRNPIYLAVLAIIVGQGLLFGITAVLVWAGVVAAACHVFVVGYEEPTLRRRYGQDYDTYCAAVRRWWPRWRSWQGSGER
jgi:protein-S-isoprenylcysteine O-methyltransferase Ste14